jgi:purine nucleoside permease
MKKRFYSPHIFLSLFFLICTTTTLEAAPEKPLEIKVVVVTMFEIGELEGDRAGEFQLWKAGLQLNERYPFPQSHQDIYLNSRTGVLGIVTGMGTARAASAIMALGLDDRFDLSRAYWLVAGIAGVDPNDASVGSAIWANWLVDGDLNHHIDAREIPEDWSTGYFPLFNNKPPETGETVADSQLIAGNAKNGEVYQLNDKLSRWAYEITQNVELSHYPALVKLRNQYTGFPNAMRPPFVLMGDQLAASTFWHGEKLNQWANDIVYYWTQGQGNYVTTGMEDTGSFQSMLYLDRAGRADQSRFMVLRTASNYSMPPPGVTAADNLTAESGEEGFAGLQASVENAYLVGSLVVKTLINNWPRYKEILPYETEVHTQESLE